MFRKFRYIATWYTLAKEVVGKLNMSNDLLQWHTEYSNHRNRKSKKM